MFIYLKMPLLAARILEQAVQEGTSMSHRSRGRFSVIKNSLDQQARAA
jgi:hypothetical protein